MGLWHGLHVQRKENSDQNEKWNKKTSIHVFFLQIIYVFYVINWYKILQNSLHDPHKNLKHVKRSMPFVW